MLGFFFGMGCVRGFVCGVLGDVFIFCVVILISVCVYIEIYGVCNDFVGEFYCIFDR